MTIFWKIYLTIFLFTVILFITGIVILPCNDEIGFLLMLPCIIQLALLLLLGFLDLIWDWSWF